MKYCIFILAILFGCKQQKSVEDFNRSTVNVQTNFYNAPDSLKFKIIDFVEGGGCGTRVSIGNYIGVNTESNDTIRVLTYCDYGDEWEVKPNDIFIVKKDTVGNLTHASIPVMHGINSNGKIYVPRIFYFPYKTTFGKIGYKKRKEQVPRKFKR